MSKEVSCRIVRVLSLEFISLSCGEILYAGIRLKVELDPEGFSLGVDPFECVRAIAIHVSVAIGSSSFGEKDGYLMN